LTRASSCGGRRFIPSSEEGACVPSRRKLSHLLNGCCGFPSRPCIPGGGGLRPLRRAYDLIRPPLRRNAGEDPTHVQNVWVRTVALHGLAVHPPDIGCPAEIVRVGEAAGLAVALGYSWTFWHTRQELVALLEGVDADAVLLSQGPEDGDESLVHYTILEVPCGLWRCPEVRVLQESSRRIALELVFVTAEKTRVPQAPADAWRTRRGEPLFIEASEGDYQESSA
jgi:hypothetical protein